MRATVSHDQKLVYVVQLATALAENGLDNGDSVREGFRKPRTEGGQYFPSVPEFVPCCKPDQNLNRHYPIAPIPQAFTKETSGKYALISKNLMEWVKGVLPIQLMLNKPFSDRFFFLKNS